MNELTELRRMRAGLTEADPGRIAAIRDQVTGRFEDEDAAPGRPAERRRRTVVRVGLAGGLTVATAAAATVALIAGGRHAGPLGTPDAAAAELLSKAAVVAEAEPGIHPRPHQYVRVDTLSRYLELPANNAGLRAPVYVKVHDQTWWRADGKGDQLLRRAHVGKPAPLPPATTLPPTLPYEDDGDELTKDCGAGPLAQTYAWVSALPTDPAGLRQKLFGPSTSDNHGRAPAPDLKWAIVSDALERGVTSPKLLAALFRLAAQIPGAHVVPHASDALGKPGTAIQFTNRLDPADEPQETQLIFDAKSLRYLGSRTVLGTARPGLPAGTVMDATSVVKINVADKLPRVEHGTVRPHC